MSEKSVIQTLSPAIDSFFGEMQKSKRIAGYTLAQLSDLSGVPLTNINRFFSGALTDPKLFNTAAICKLLNFSIDEHFGIAASADSRLQSLTEKKETLTRELEELRHSSERMSLELSSAQEQLTFHKEQSKFREEQLRQKDKLLDERADFLRLKDRAISSRNLFIAIEALALAAVLMGGLLLW